MFSGLGSKTDLTDSLFSTDFLGSSRLAHNALLQAESLLQVRPRFGGSSSSAERMLSVPFVQGVVTGWKLQAHDRSDSVRRQDCAPETTGKTREPARLLDQSLNVRQKYR